MCGSWMPTYSAFIDIYLHTYTVHGCILGTYIYIGLWFIDTYIMDICAWFIHTYIHTYIHIYIHTYIHTHTHTYIHTHTY